MNKRELENQLAGLKGDLLDDFAQGERLHEKWAAECWDAFQKSKPTPDVPKALREYWKSPGYRDKPFDPVIGPQ